MTKQQALDRLNLIRVWYEDYGTPDADYDAICYAINIIEAQPEKLDTLIKALEQEHKKLLEMQKALKNVPDTNVGDTISRQAAIDALCSICGNDCDKSEFVYNAPQDEQVIMCPEHYVLSTLPPAQPEPCEIEQYVETCEECGFCDTISRRSSIDAVNRLSLGETDAVRLSIRISDYLKRLQPAEPKTGKWIKHIDDLFPEESTIECDQCHEHQPLTIDDNFCPNCGAKMEGVSE